MPLSQMTSLQDCACSLHLMLLLIPVVLSGTYNHGRHMPLYHSLALFHPYIVANLDKCAICFLVTSRDYLA